MRACVWLTRGDEPPGQLATVELAPVERDAGRITLRSISVIDEVGTGLLGGDDLCFDHALGGGPLATPSQRRSAQAFAVVNVAYHLQRAMDTVETLLGRRLPNLVAGVGMHRDHPEWGGAHYRLPAPAYTELPEQNPVIPTGEIHFSSGARYIPWREGRYFHAPGHNPAIICHEFGHHVCRHTADFRLNGRRFPLAQGNRKIPLDEGTADYLAAILTGTPDIFGWQRSDIPHSSPHRRCLDAPWTMRHYRGSSGHDPHLEGTVWAAALWATRTAVFRAGVDPQAFDRVVVRGLDRRGRWESDLEWDEALRFRRHFSRLLEAMLEVEQEMGGCCATIIERTFADRGIRVGYSNRVLRDTARQAAPLGAR